MSTSSQANAVIEVKYLSINSTHIQVEFTDESGYLEEAWLPLDSVEPDFNILHDIMDLEVSIDALDEAGIPHE